jgi:hypothetical protein
LKTTIKADSATVEGDYVIVRKIPYRTTRLCLWLTFPLVLIACLLETAPFFIIIGVIFIYLILNSILSHDEATYTVPKRDLVAIKQYPRKRKVTVVFDDEKSKLEILK